MSVYNAGEVTKATEVPFLTLNAWTNKGIVETLNFREGKGKHRVYERMEVIALGYAYQWRLFGVSLESTRSIISLVRKYTEEELKKLIKEGYTTVIVGPGIEPDLIKGRPYSQEPEYTLGSVYASIIEKLDQ